MDLFAKINPENPMSVLTDAILAGEIKGVAAFAGCNNQKTNHDYNDVTCVKKMVENDVFVISTGCSASAFAKQGFLSYDGVEECAGPGLRKFIDRLSEAAGLPYKLPLVFHMGSCVDNSRIVEFYFTMAKALGVPAPQVPFVGAAPEAMSEKAIAIGTYLISNGIPTYVGVTPPVEGSELVYGVTTEIARDVFGGFFIFDPNPETGAEKMLQRIEDRAWKLRVRHAAAEKYGSKPVNSFDGQ
jgi:carbon-monoxide dehydrogenase catalytic subunit